MARGEYDYDDREDSEGGRGRPEIPNHLVKSILATLFCCLPLGVVSIIFAAQVNGKIDAGALPGGAAPLGSG